MFIYLFPDVSIDDAKEKILSTQSGKEIMDKNASYLYDTIQSNLNNILAEMAECDNMYNVNENQIEKAYRHAFRK